MKIETIIIDWNDVKSIKQSEKIKTKLENKGFELVNVQTNLITNVSKLIYQL